MPEDIVPTIEGQILGLLSSVIDDFIPERNKIRHGVGTGIEWTCVSHKRACTWMPI
jgi:hypothetical protein